MALIDRVLTDPAAAEALGALDERLRGGPIDWAAMVHDNKRAVADGILRSEVLRIGRELRVAIPDAPADTEDAVGELIACFPVYRSYLPGGRDHLDEAFALAREHRPDLADTLDVLLPILSDPQQPPALRFQQTVRHGDGQGRRGLLVLPLVPAHLAQRGRRRPLGLLRHHRRVARRDGRPASATGRTR